MSDFDYRNNNYNDQETIRKEDIEVETRPVHHSHYSCYDYIPEEPVREKKKKGNWITGALKVSGFAAIFGIAAGCTLGSANTVKENMAPSASSQVETTMIGDKDATADSNQTVMNTSSSQSATAIDVSSVVNEVMPSVVSITGTYRTSNYYGVGSQESQGAGSGFIIAEDDNRLLIATNNHVVVDSSSLSVGFVDNTSAPAAIVGKDSNADLAVISVDKKDVSDDTSNKIKIATLGSSESLKVGEPVIAIGNALGYGQSVTTGVVSAKDREVSFTDGTMTLLQTDAAINPGNSGGVLINLKGEVVGINNAKLEDTSVEGMGYAIPISTADSILNDLMNVGEISAEDASYLGIVGENIDANYSEAMGMPEGIYVSQVTSGSPAEKSGIMAGDIIIALDGNNVSTMDGLKEKLSIKKAGTKVTVTVKRANQNGEYEEKEIKATLGKASDFQEANSDSQAQNANGQDENGPNGNGQYPGGQNNNGQYPGGDGGYYNYDNGESYGNSGNDFDPYYYFFN